MTEVQGAAPPVPVPSAERRVLRALLAASALSKVADWQLGIVLPLAVLAQTGSMASALLAFAFRGLAYVVSPIVGLVIDRYDRSRTYVLAQFQQAVCLVLAALWIDRPLALSAVLLLSGLGGVASSITAQFVLVPQLFPTQSRERTSARLGAVIEYSKIAGMLLGGLAVSAVSPAFGALCIALLYVLAGCVALLLPRAPSARLPTDLWGELGVGVRWLRRPEVLWLVVSLSVMNLAVGQLETVLLTSSQLAGFEAVVTSLVLAAGLLVAGLASRTTPHALRRMTAEQRIAVCQAVCLIALVVLALPGTATKVLGYFLYSAGIGGVNISSVVYRQSSIPVEVAGRVNSVMRMFIAGSIPASAVVYAGADQLDGVLFWVPGLVLMATALLVWSLHLLRSRTT